VEEGDHDWIGNHFLDQIPFFKNLPLQKKSLNFEEKNVQTNKQKIKNKKSTRKNFIHVSLCIA